MKFINFTIIKLSICLVFGIVMAYLLQGNLFFGFWGLLICLPILFILWLSARKQLVPTIYFGLLTFLCFIFLGSFIYQLKLPQFQQHHYSHILTENDNQLLKIKITEILKPNAYNQKYLGKIKALNQHQTTGTILLNIEKDSINKLLNVDDVVLVYGKLFKINEPLNPYQFDYSKYMKTLDVYNQLKITQKQILNIKTGTVTIKGRAESIRNNIIKKLKESPLKKEEISIIQALILGQRKDISKQLYKDYATAGAIHILAVSGLHVGILYFILGFLYKPLEFLPKGKIIKSICIIICLWSFAIIAGLSPSVVRAVTMFSFLIFATIINRESNSINTLFISFFVLLLIKPLWLFHVGFQLSYIAVFSILWIQPKLYYYYQPSYYLDKLFWSIITVTIAAQIGIIPLSIYYFHQLPTLSLITNLVVLPFLGIILGLGILVVLLTVFNLLPIWFSNFYNAFIKMLNQFIIWVANQEGFLIENIFFSFQKMIGWYVVLISIIILWKKPSFQKIIVSLSCISLLICIRIFDKAAASKNEFVIFHKNRHTLIGNKFGENLQLLSDDTIINIGSTFPIKGYLTSQNIKNFSILKLPKIIQYKEKKLVILDSFGIYPYSKKIDIVMLTSSPKINLNRLIDQLQPQFIIADGSNYTSYKNRWKKTCNKRGIVFHNTSIDGAFIIE